LLNAAAHSPNGNAQDASNMDAFATATVDDQYEPVCVIKGDEAIFRFQEKRNVDH
jgi:hypothetical protein